MVRRLPITGHDRVPLTDSEFGLIPQGWSWADLRDIGKITMGQSPPSSAYNTVADGLPFHQGVGTFGAHFPIIKTYSTLGDRFAEAGDVLVSVRAPVGRINVADTRLILGRGLCGIRGVKTPSSFLLYALKNVFVEEDSMGNGAIFKAVTKKDVETIPIIWPGEALVRKFSAHVESLTNLIGVLVRALETLRTTRDLLLPRLVSGDIDVDELNIEFPDAA